jgi:prepilin-type N-terminal cleavage/methylation domain-containing protein
MKIRKKRRRAGSGGFTLVEVLAALAIASVIILASTALIHNVALFFDRGTRGVTEAERVVLAVERLSGDFSSARFVSRRTEDGSAAVAFTAELATNDRTTSIVFVGAARVGAPPALTGDELISLAIEEDGEVRRLVRRRAPWPGPSARFEDVTLQDAVVLIEGKLDISFVFGRVTPDGGLAWYANWAGERALPRYVRLMLRDRATGPICSVKPISLFAPMPLRPADETMRLVHACLPYESCRPTYPMKKGRCDEMRRSAPRRDPGDRIVVDRVAFGTCDGGGGDLSWVRGSYGGRARSRARRCPFVGGARDGRRHHRWFG